MISADMEGATGVTWADDVKAGTEQWQRFRHMFTSDVNAAIAGLHTAGATDVGLNAALAAEHGVPVILVTGDDRTCADANDYAPAAQTVAVKECVSRYAAICTPPSVTAEWITAAATKAMSLAGAVEPVVAAHRIEIEFDATHLAAASAIIPTVEQVDDRRIGFDAPNMTEAMKA